MNVRHGVDISAVQGVLDPKVWAALKAKDIDFALHRFVVGNDAGIDSAAKENISRAEDAGIQSGKYLFAYPLPHIDPVKQVDEWFSKIEKSGSLAGEIPNAIDLEWPPREEWQVVNGVRTLVYPWKKWGCSAQQILEWGLAALERGLQLSGVPWFVYSFRYFLDCIDAANSAALGQFPLWLADYATQGHYTTADEMARVKIPAPWNADGSAGLVIMQNDGDGGLLLPNGRDADFNVANADLLNALIAMTGTPKEEPAPIDTEAARLDMNGLIVDADIDRYRRERVNDLLDAA